MKTIVKPCLVFAEGSQIATCMLTKEAVTLNRTAKTRFWALHFSGRVREPFAAAFIQEQDYQIVPYYKNGELEKTWATNYSSSFHPHLDYDRLWELHRSYKAEFRKKYVSLQTCNIWSRVSEDSRPSGPSVGPLGDARTQLKNPSLVQNQRRQLKPKSVSDMLWVVQLHQLLFLFSSPFPFVTYMHIFIWC